MNVRIRQYRNSDEKFLEPMEDVMRWHPEYERIWKEVVRKEWTWTGLSNDGEILAVGGIVPLQENTAFMWVQIGRKRKTDILRILRKGFKMFDSFNFDVWYAYVKNEFKQGCRVAEFLGFKKIESVIEGYSLYENKRR